MNRIDSTRLSKVLAALAKPKDRVTSSTASSPTAVNVKKGAKDLEVLRAHLQSRLQDLKKNTENFHEMAPVITVQEILRWEFGDSILEHPEFGNISKKVAATMLENQQLEKAIYGIVDRMVSPAP
ncbi:hypothetical protein [Pseudomonas sp. FW305-70]|jgi:hypothetical protein|uniref:hypothetical protein n=1 Tax=Pseudomonas sp. FW305-70 TaxID=2751342 RepID=UPI000C889488|nr:hypothetical protein [Pseudomonas sp. FW305-70]PMZ70067.1 hypothetical protein C1X65_27005 [Pseudomonas sp. FW305-70]